MNMATIKTRIIDFWRGCGKSQTMPTKQAEPPPVQQQQKSPAQIVAEFGGDPMQPSPALLRQIAIALAGDGGGHNGADSESKATQWAEAFLAAYPYE